MFFHIIQSTTTSSVKYILYTQILGYSFRQKLYSEFLEGSTVEKQITTFLSLQQQHTLQITDVVVFTGIVCIVSLYLNDLKYKKSFETIVNKKKETTSVFIHQHIELLFFIFAIIFTKDIENAI